MANDYFNWGIQLTQGTVIGTHSLGANGDFSFGTGDFTIEACFSFVNTVQVGGYQVVYIGSSAGSYSDGTLAYGLGFTSASNSPAVFFCNDSLGNTIKASIASSTGSRPDAANGFRFLRGQSSIMHWSGTRSGTTAKFFLDGVEKTSTTGIGSTITANFPSNKIQFGDPGNKIFYYFRISDVARDATWLAAHYQDKFYTDANVVGLYNFSTELGTGTTIYDTSGNNRHGVLSAAYGQWVKVSNVYEGRIGPL